MKIYTNLKEVPPHLSSRAKLYKQRLKPIGEIKAKGIYAGKQVELFDIKETVQIRSHSKESLELRERKRKETSKKIIQKLMEQDENQDIIYKVYGFSKLNEPNEGRIYVAIKESQEREFMQKVHDGEYEYDVLLRNLILETDDKEKVAKIADIFIDYNSK